MEGYTPLHVAMNPGDPSAFYTLHDDEQVMEGVVEALLTAAPGTSLLKDAAGNTPLHYAAAVPTSRRAIQMLLHVAPTTLHVQNLAGKTPLDLALESAQTHAECFISADHPRRVLSSLLASELGRTLVPSFLRASQPLPAECWDMLPPNMPGLAAAIPEVVTRGLPGDLRRLTALLNADEKRQLTHLLGVLGHVASALPLDLVKYLTSLVFDFDVHSPGAEETFDLPVCHFPLFELSS